MSQWKILQLMLILFLVNMVVNKVLRVTTEQQSGRSVTEKVRKGRS